MTRFAAVIFDMDGLLLDSERPIRDAWILACRELGIDLTVADYESAIGLNPADSKRHLSAKLGDRISFEVAEARMEAILARTHPGSTFALKDGAPDLLRLLHDLGASCAVASSSHHAEVRKRLHAAGVLEAFDTIAGGDEVHAGKPSPDLYLLAKERLAIAHSVPCLVFEDSEPGAIAALSASMSVIVVPDLRRPSEATAQRCLATLSSLTEAIPLCETWFGSAR